MQRLAEMKSESKCEKKSSFFFNYKLFLLAFLFPAFGNLQEKNYAHGLRLTMNRLSTYLLIFELLQYIEMNRTKVERKNRWVSQSSGGWTVHAGKWEFT